MSLIRKIRFLINKSETNERQTLRKNIDLVVEYKKNYETKLKRGYSSNISLGGISLEGVTDFCALNTYLNIKIPLPSNYYKESIMAEAIVVNSKRIKKDKYSYGLRFTRLSNADRNIIKDIVNNEQ